MRDKNKVIELCKKLMATANDSAAADNERDVALRKVNEMVIAHNLGRDEIERNGDEFDVRKVECGRYRVFSFGRNLLGWQSNLGNFVLSLFKSVQWYRKNGVERDDKLQYKLAANPPRAVALYFYGPDEDAECAAKLFEELQEVMATMAKLRYGKFASKDGADYCEGFVEGLAWSNQKAMQDLERSNQETYGLIVMSDKLSLVLKDRGTEYLANVHGIDKLKKGQKRVRRGVSNYSAMSEGYEHGKKHSIDKPKSTGKITGKQNRLK